MYKRLKLLGIFSREKKVDGQGPILAPARQARAERHFIRAVILGPMGAMALLEVLSEPSKSGTEVQKYHIRFSYKICI